MSARRGPSPSRSSKIAGLRRVVIVGGSLAGIRAAQALRRKGYDGRLILVGEEPHLPYNRPPLSKQVLVEKGAPVQLDLLSEADYSTLALDLRLGQPADALDLAGRRVILADGEQLGYDGLIVATGASPWRPTGWAMDGVYQLRTIDDALALRAEFEKEPQVVVVGGGFIGCEVAASARARGLTVTLVEAMESVMLRSLGPQIARLLTDAHLANGVMIRCGVGVSRLEGSRRVQGVRLGDGTLLAADVVVVGLGARPETRWLDSSGLTVSDGIVCDQWCAAAPGVYAAGDVTRWHHPRLGMSTRVEHWTNAAEQAEVAAHNLLAGAGGRVPYDPVPYFWSDQYDIKIQAAGWARPDDEFVQVLGDADKGRLVGLYRRDDRLVGAATLNWPRWSGICRRLLAAGLTMDEALDAINRAA